MHQHILVHFTGGSGASAEEALNKHHPVQGRQGLARYPWSDEELHFFKASVWVHRGVPKQPRLVTVQLVPAVHVASWPRHRLCRSTVAEPTEPSIQKDKGLVVG